MRTSTIFDANNFGFFEICCSVSVRTREGEGSASADKGQFFATLCERPLIIVMVALKMTLCFLWLKQGNGSAANKTSCMALIYTQIT